MRLPWNKPEVIEATEVRAATDYDAVIVQLLQNQAAGNSTTASASATASLEAGAGLYGRSLAVAELGAHR